MNVTTALDQMEEIFSRDVSDEALEVAAAPGKEIAARYTLQFCTSVDCAS